MRQGRVIDFDNKPRVAAWSAVVGEKEGKGPLGGGFDMIVPDEVSIEKTWEQAESDFQKRSIAVLLNKSDLTADKIDVIYAGDLLNQCSGSSFGLGDYNIPFSGVYGACSTSVLAMINAAIGVDSGVFEHAISATSSHFCSAEKQFRFPLEYGGQRTSTSQWTVTGAGSALISGEAKRNSPVISKAILGKIVDKGVTDANNMGAAMAPAAADTIAAFLRDTGTTANDYDLILTGDLGVVGSELLHKLMQTEYGIDISEAHNDTGLMMYYIDEQDVHAGASGCACCGTVMCSKILNELADGTLKSVLVVATGALLSTVSPLQGQSIPGIAHGILLTSGRVEDE